MAWCCFSLPLSQYEQHVTECKNPLSVLFGSGGACCLLAPRWQWFQVIKLELLSPTCTFGMIAMVVNCLGDLFNISVRIRDVLIAIFWLIADYQAIKTLSCWYFGLYHFFCQECC